MHEFVLEKLAYKFSKKKKNVLTADNLKLQSYNIRCLSITHVVQVKTWQLSPGEKTIAQF